MDLFYYNFRYMSMYHIIINKTLIKLLKLKTICNFKNKRKLNPLMYHQNGLIGHQPTDHKIRLS